jgi:diguanylate cyclase (GGDEF)-like protein/PAS domain S-box-containing protein
VFELDTGPQGIDTLPLLVVSRRDDNVAAVNSLLRNRGLAVRCHRIGDPDELEELGTSRFVLLCVFSDEADGLLEDVVRIRQRIDPDLPVLSCRGGVDMTTIDADVVAGAADAVSLEQPDRFCRIVDRERRRRQLALSLREAMVAANAYRDQLRTMMAGSTDAIAQVAEGIVLDANPSWLQLFGYGPEDELAGTPVMDLFATDSQASLKGALVACMRGQWPGDMLRLAGIDRTGGELAVEMSLEPSSFDGEPSVRISVAPESNDDDALIEDLHDAVRRDPSTGLFGRQFLLERLTEKVAVPPSGGVRALAIIRPDGFGDVVEVVGPIASEKILKAMAATLRDLAQPSDLYGRFGGTTFAALLGRGNHRDVKAWAHEYCRRISSQLFELGDKSLSLTCTIGLSIIEGRCEDLEAAFQQALECCNTGRSQGGGRVAMRADDAATTAMHERDRLWVPRIKQALLDSRFRLANQPIASLAGADPGFVDILIRMLDEQGDEVLPGEFLPAAERNKLIKNIDRWVLSATMALCARSDTVRRAFVKLSRPSVLDETLVAWLDKQIRTQGIDPQRLVLQVAESIADQHLKQTLTLAQAVRARGYGFALENFGVGPRPLQVLQHLPLDFLKIDGSLMQGLARNTELQERIAEYVGKAGERGIRTIAERVEDANTMAVLWQAGVEYLQGYQVQEPEVVLAEEPDHSA